MKKLAAISLPLAAKISMGGGGDVCSHRRIQNSIRNFIRKMPD
jgi:hypothetical protein